MLSYFCLNFRKKYQLDIRLYSVYLDVCIDQALKYKIFGSSFTCNYSFQDEEKENSPKKKKKNKKNKKAPSSTPATPEFIPLDSPGSAKKKPSSEKKKKDKKNNEKPAENIEGSAKKSKSKKKL